LLADSDRIETLAAAIRKVVGEARSL
jgi:hypothetical protein